MSHSMTYSSLKDDVEAYCDRHDDSFVAQIPRFISLAEHRLASEVRGLGFMRFIDGTLFGNVLAKPARWRETVSFSIGTDPDNELATGVVARLLYQRSYEYCRVFSPTQTNGAPRYYSDYGYDHWLIVPFPPVNYQFEIAYHELPVPLSDDNDVNWTTENAPQLLLYASLLETAPFLKNDERVQVWMGLYNQAKEALGREDARRWGDRSTSPR